MSGDPANWGSRLIFVSVCVVIGLTGFAASRSSSDRRMTFGLLAQGIVLAFVAGGHYWGHSPALRLGATLIAGLLLIFRLAGPVDVDDEQSQIADRSR